MIQNKTYRQYKAEKARQRWVAEIAAKAALAIGSGVAIGFMILGITEPRTAAGETLAEPVMESVVEPVVESVTETAMETVLWAETEPEPIAETEPELVEMGTFVVTSYCPCEICCGKWALSRPNGIVYTASGAKAQANHTIAVDPDVIPYGTTVYIDGLGEFVAEDSGSAIVGNRIDVYMTDHESARGFGKQEHAVYLVK